MNFLYENRRGHFAEIGLQTGTRYNEDGRAEAGMGVDFGDYDNDGYQDIFVTNFGFETNTLYRNSEGTYFVDVSAEVALAEPTYDPLGFGTKFLDYDNDADLDLFVANGHVLDLMDDIDTTGNLSPTRPTSCCAMMERMIDRKEADGLSTYRPSRVLAFPSRTWVAIRPSPTTTTTATSTF